MAKNMAKKPSVPNYAAFVHNARVKGMLPHFDLGGGVSLDPRMASPNTAANQQNLIAGQGLNLASGAVTPSSSAPVQNGLGGTQQGGLIGALTPQSGYQATTAPTQNLNYVPVANAGASAAIQGLTGLEGTAAGTGPNPALSQLNQTTGQNVQNQAALAAGVRGASANPGLVARNAALAGNAAQSNAVSNAATLQAQQQLAAQNALASNNLFGAAAGANAAQNNTNVSNVLGAEGINAATASSNAQAGQKTSGGLFGGIGSAISGLGSLIGLADGGSVPAPSATTATGGPSSFVGKFLSKASSGDFSSGMDSGLAGIGSTLGKGISSLFSSPSTPSSTTTLASSNAENADWAGAPGSAMSDMGASVMAKGGAVRGKPVPAMVSPGEAYLPPDKVDAVARGAKPLSVAEKIPGKAKVKGDSLKNDVVPKTLESGGIVIPKSVMESQNPEGHAARFVQAIMAKQGPRRRNA